MIKQALSKLASIVKGKPADYPELSESMKVVRHEAPPEIVEAAKQITQAMYVNGAPGASKGQKRAAAKRCAIVAVHLIASTLTDDPSNDQHKADYILLTKEIQKL